MPFYEESLRTDSRNELIDVTARIKKAVSASGVREGLCVIYNPHTTAGFTINEAADPDVKRDMTTFLNKLIPQDPAFRHMEGNSDSHIKTTLTGPSVNIPIHKGNLVLGTWQGIYFTEYDGPRSRRFFIKIIDSD